MHSTIELGQSPLAKWWVKSYFKNFRCGSQKFGHVYNSAGHWD